MKSILSLRPCALLLALCLILTGCGGVPAETATESTVQGPYYAQWPDSQTALADATDGVMVGDTLFAICGGTRLLKTDAVGNLITELSVPLEADQTLACICSADENLALLRVDGSAEQGYTTELLTMGQDGALLSQSPLPIDAFPVGLATTEQGGYLIGCENQMVYQFNQSMEITAEGSCENLSDVFTAGKQILLLQVYPETPDSNARTILSLWQESNISRICTLDATCSGAVTRDGYIFLSGTETLWAVNATTQEATELLTWESLGLNGASQTPIAGASVQQVLFSSRTLSDANVLLLTTTAPEPDEHTVTITLAYWALTAADQMAIQSFNRSQNDYQIETICYYPEDGDVTTALTRMNADLLTGDAPDLYALNGMDVDVLQNRGLLMDLLPLMEQDETFSTEDYYTNIWELFRVNGCLYEFVPSFSLAGLAGTQDVLGDRTGWTLAEFEAFSQSGTPVDTSSSVDFLYNCIRYGVHHFLDTEHFTCSFDTGDMEQLLSVSSLLNAEGGQSGMLREYWMSGIFSYQQMLTEVGRELRFVGYPSQTATGPTVNAFYTYAISSSSQCPKGAWEFLKFLLRDNQQNFYLSDGFPIKKSVNEAAFQKAMLPFTDEKSLFYGYEGQPLSETEIEYVRQLIDNASQRYLRYQQVLTIVEEEAQAYFSGDKTAEDVCALIQNRVSIYLAEQN